MRHPSKSHFWQTRRRLRRRAMTLVEIMIVMAILVLMFGVLVVGTGQTASARLRESGAMLTGAIKIAYSRASSSGKPVRLVLDADKNSFWLEEGDVPMLVQSNDKMGTGGAEAATDLELAARAEAASIVNKPLAPRSKFHAIEPFGLSPSSTDSTEKVNIGEKGMRKLPKGIQFQTVQTTHDGEPRAGGRSYLYFWPGGLTERASIQLQSAIKGSSESTLSLLVSPLTGKVVLKAGAVPLKMPKSEDEASEREAPGGF